MNIQIQYGPSIALYAACFLLTAALAGLAQIFQQKRQPVTLAATIEQNNRPNWIFWILSMMIPLLLSSFRWQVGTDYSTYVYLYNSFFQMDSLSKFFDQILITEPSFIVLNLIVKAFFNSYIFVFAFSALLILAFFYRAIEDYHEQNSVMIAVIVFLCLFFGTSLNILRQMIAVAIAFYATRYVFQKKYTKAALWLLAAVSFHYSALIILPFWFLRSQKRWQKNTRIMLFIILVLIVVGDLLFRSAFEQLPFVSAVTESTAEGAYLSYGLLLLRLPIIVPVLVFRKRLIEHDERNYYWIILMVFEVAFSHLGYIFDVFNRIALYFAVSWIILLPSMIRCMPTRSKQYGMGAYVLIVVTFLWIYNMWIKNYGDVLPYMSIFDSYFSGML